MILTLVYKIFIVFILCFIFSGMFLNISYAKMHGEAVKKITIKHDGGIGEDDFNFITGILNFGDNKTNVQNITLPNVINRILKILFTLTGIALVVSITIQGTLLIYDQFTGNVGKLVERKKHITSILIGMAVLMFSWLILNTVNPNLLNLENFLRDFKITESQETKDASSENAQSE